MGGRRDALRTCMPFCPAPGHLSLPADGLASMPRLSALPMLAMSSCGGGGGPSGVTALGPPDGALAALLLPCSTSQSPGADPDDSSSAGWG